MRNLVTVGFALALVGCGSSDPPAPSSDMAAVVITNFDSINSEILQKSCAKFSVCHSPDGASKAGHLNLKDDPWGQLVGVQSDNAKAQSQGLLRVKPCDSAHSFLAIKLLLTSDLDPRTDYGHHMPDTNPSLPMGEIQAIKDWIDRGALQNEPATVGGATCQVTDMGTAPSSD
jgi:hypothetical protein